jgi:hypothetical protein
VASTLSDTLLVAAWAKAAALSAVRDKTVQAHNAMRRSKDGFDMR